MGEIELKLYWRAGLWSVGAAKNHHCFCECPEVFALFLVLLILAFFCLRPVLHPGVLPNDVAGAAEVRAVKGRFLGEWVGLEGQSYPHAGWALTWAFLPRGQRRGPT